MESSLVVNHNQSKVPTAQVCQDSLHVNTICLISTAYSTVMIKSITAKQCFLLSNIAVWVNIIKTFLENLYLSTLKRHRQNGRHFVYIFIYFFLSKDWCILSPISLKFVYRSPIDNNPAFVQIMASRPNRRQTIDGLIYWCIHASLGRNEVMIYAKNLIARNEQGPLALSAPVSNELIERG